jgi:hypothetical protein
MNRRSFLCAAGAALGGGLAAPLALGGPRADARKLIILQFGGGTRNSECIDDPQHRYIPHLWNELVPRGTLFTNVRVENRVVHPNSTGSMMTGHWEWDDLDWSRPVANPTVFELYRRARRAPDTQTWAFVYASILARTGESRAAGYGRDYAANVVEPPTIPRRTSKQMDQLMHRAAASGEGGAGRRAARECAALAKRTSRIARSGLRSPRARAFLERQYARWRGRDGTTSHDAFLTDCAVAAMKTFAPAVIAIDYGEIDCAHYGSWSRYVEAIRRTDALTARVWQTVGELPAYRDNTLLLVMPDHGRELERGDGWGFIHHSDFYTDRGADEGCRRVWMLALGPGVTAGRKVATPVPLTASAATGLEFLGLEPSRGAAESVLGRTA